jgi:hypothetical protein
MKSAYLVSAIGAPKIGVAAWHEVQLSLTTPATSHGTCCVATGTAGGVADGGKAGAPAAPTDVPVGGSAPVVGRPPTVVGGNAPLPAMIGVLPERLLGKASSPPHAAPASATISAVDSSALSILIEMLLYVDGRSAIASVCV